MTKEEIRGSAAGQIVLEWCTVPMWFWGMLYVMAGGIVWLMW